MLKWRILQRVRNDVRTLRFVLSCLEFKNMYFIIHYSYMILFLYFHIVEMKMFVVKIKIGLC